MKRKRQKRRKEKKRSEEKKALPRLELGPLGAPGDSSITKPRGTHTRSYGISIIKTFKPYYSQTR